MANHDVDDSPRTRSAGNLHEDEAVVSDAASEYESLRSLGSEPEEHPPGFEETRTEEHVLEQEKRADDEALRAQSLLLAIRTRNAFHSRRRNVTDAPPEPNTLPVLLNCRRHFH
eukprot:TRINITY_DN28276_c0_g5_i1.p3 TRINITY_DN28276_c0_g5~~TRINITY_DN28276_c0_g5_i1.p3  ORF type:complete len:114 (-),score=16.45 TRINITY_DN28276_c0_g5_i1:577-918(-)